MTCVADLHGVFNCPARVISQKDHGAGGFQMALEIPVRPIPLEAGQFIMVKLAPGVDPFLRRPFSIYDVRPGSSGRTMIVELFYAVVGGGTRFMSALRAGDRVEVHGPLGEGFVFPRTLRRALIVAGGIGITGLYLLARALRPGGAGANLIRPVWTGPRLDLDVLIGARSRELVFARSDFEELGCSWRVATEDGSAGEKGYVTVALEDELRRIHAAGRRETVVFSCGPWPMLEAVERLCRKYRMDSQLSLDRRMACGLSACRICVCLVRDDHAPEGIANATVCTDGPVFNGRRLLLTEEMPAGRQWGH